VNNLMVLMCSVVLMLLSSLSLASSIIAGGWSYHQNRDKEYNEVHYNLGYKQDGWSVLYYLNSKEHTTVMFGKDFNFITTEHWSLGAVGGIATGYSDVNGIVPFGTLRASYDYKHLGIDFHSVPGAVYQVQLRYNFDYTVAVPFNGKSDLAVSYGYGLNGGGLAFHYKLNDNLNIRLYNNRGYKNWSDTWFEDYTETGIYLYQTETIHLDMFGLTLDWYPYKNFGLYGGVVYNNNQYKTRYYTISKGDWYGDININKEPIRFYTTEGLKGVVEWDDIGYTYGLRYGNPFNSDGWSWYVDAGVTTMSGVSGVATFIRSEGEGIPYDDARMAEIDTKLVKWVDKEELKYSKYKLIPKIEVGLQYRF